MYPAKCGHYMMTSSNGSIFRFTWPLRGEFIGHRWIPSQRPVTQRFDVFFHLCLNQRLSKQSWGWWFETPSRSLWRHCNDLLWYFCYAYIFRTNWIKLDDLGIFIKVDSVAKYSLWYHRISIMSSHITNNSAVCNSLLMLTTNITPKLSIIGESICYLPVTIDSPHKGQVIRNVHQCHGVILVDCCWYYYSSYLISSANCNWKFDIETGASMVFKRGRLCN